MTTILPPFLIASWMLAVPAGVPASVRGVSIKVENPLSRARTLETIALRIGDVVKIAPGLDASKLVITDGSGDTITSQLVDMDGDEKPDELVFQSGFAANESRTFAVRSGDRRRPTREEFRVYGRFVRERHDDFVWENDRVAHRMYGPDLETWKAEPLTSSGVDVWCKRVRRLVANDWYLTDNYHQDTGEGADLYSVKTSRGCGGTGVWTGGQLHVSKNFVASRVLANGPIRLIFDLDYAPWDAAGRPVSETKRVMLDAGKNFNRFESTFKTAAGTEAPLSIAFGIAKHENAVIEVDRRSGWARSWEPLKKGNGNLGCAIVAPPRISSDFHDTKLDQLMTMNARPGVPVVVYAGSAWDRGGEVTDGGGWAKLVEGFAQELATPLRVSLSPLDEAASTGAKGAAARDTRGAPGALATADQAGGRTLALRTCDSVVERNPILTEKWTYDAGLVLQACWRVATAANDKKMLDWVKTSVDRLLDADGGIKGYRAEDYNLDNINMGKLLFPLLARSADDKEKQRYKAAIFQLRAQLKNQPRTSDGAFWHKLVYPRQMWLDGVYMASPFLAEFAVTFNEPSLLDDVARQILLAEKHMRDPKSGLLYHGWDETKDQRWANPRTGTSSQFWGRAMGWYAMAIVDVLEVMPRNHPQREAVLAVLRRLATAIAAVQDRKSGVWWQVLDAPGRGQNYEEASASAMFVYALSKACARGWLDSKRYDDVAARGYQGIVSRFVENDAAGHVDVKSVCKVAGLGGTPYRDGSFDYYTHTEVVVNDPKGVGAFILASVVQGRPR